MNNSTVLIKGRQYKVENYMLQNWISEPIKTKRLREKMSMTRSLDTLLDVGNKKNKEATA